MLKTFRAILKWIGILLCLTVLLFSAALFYLQTDHARFLILETINQRIPGTLSCEKLHFSLFKGEFEVKGVVLRGPATDPFIGEIAAIDRLRIDLAWHTLFKGIVWIESLLLEHPRAALRIDREGTLNLLRAFSVSQSIAPQASDETKSRFPLGVVVQDFQISKGALRYHSEPQHLEAFIEGLDLQANADLGQQSGSLALEIAQLMSRGDGYQTRPARLRLKASMKGGRIEPLACDVTTADVRLKLSGMIEDVFDHPAMNLLLDLDAGAAEIQETLQLKGDWSGRLTGQLIAEGTMANPAATLTLNYSGGKLANYTIERLDAAILLQNRLATLKTLESSGKNIQLTANGRLDLVSHKIAATVKLKTPDMQPFLASLGISELKGGLDLNATVDGSLEQPVVTCELQGHDLGYQEIAIGTLRLNAALDASGILKISPLKVEHRRSTLELSATGKLFQTGTFKLRKQPEINLTIKDSSIFLEDFHHTFKGQLALSGHVEGDLKRPRGRLQVAGRKFDFGVQKIESIQLQADCDGQTLQVRPLTIAVAPGELIRGQAGISFDRQYKIDLQSTPIALKAIGPLSDLNLAGGNIRLNISGSGSLLNPELQGKCSLTDLRVNHKKIEDLNVNLLLKNQQINFSAHQAFDLDGFYDLSRKDFSAVLVFNNTKLAPYFTIAGQKDLKGTLNGRIEARGNTAAAGNIEVEVDFSRLLVLLKAEELLNAKEFRLNLKDQTLSIAAIDLALLQAGRMQISGAGDLDGALNFQAEGLIPLKALGFLSEDVTNLQGALQLSARIEGRMQQPEVRADLRLQNIGLTVIATQQTLQKINGRIRVTPQEIGIERIEGKLDGGRFELTGGIDLERFQPSRIRLAANAFALPLQMPDTLHAVINSRLNFEGRPEKSLLKGEIVILDGAYVKDINLSLLQVFEPKKRKTAPAAAEIQLPFLKNLKLDIFVKHRNPFRIDNNLAQLTVIPDLHLGGTLNQPILSGRAAIESGTITYRQKEFIVQKGVLDFVNPYRIEPQIDIAGRTTIRSWKIFLTLSGTPEQLEFKLGSDPEESDEDILSLLLFGRTTHELIRKEGGATQSAEQMLAEFIATTFGKDIKETMGIDILEVETADNGTASSSDRIQVTVGKELSKRMTMKYAVESKQGEMIQRAIAEYKFFENILLRGSQDSLGTFDGSLLFRLEFR